MKTNAFEIAKRDLDASFIDGGIVASADHFNDFWARDSFYASWGYLEIGEAEKVRSNLELFIKYQKPDGQIARRIDRFYVVLNYVGLKVRRKKLKPEHNGAYISPALDPNLLFIITFGKYLEKTADTDFLRQNFTAVQEALTWLEKRQKGDFLQEKTFANWMDVIVKNGAVLYTNVLYFDTLSAFAKICASIDKAELSLEYLGKAAELKNKINQEFWNGEYYLDWIDQDKKHNYFSTDGNVLAMLWGVSDAEQNEKIIRTIQKFKLDEIPLKTNYPDYPWWRVALRMYIIGTPGYQDNFASWLWLGCVYAVALKSIGKSEEATKIQAKIAHKIEEFGLVYEIYAPDGAPYRGWFWRSAATFAWSSGLYLWMAKKLPKENA